MKFLVHLQARERKYEKFSISGHDVRNQADNTYRSIPYYV